MKICRFRNIEGFTLIELLVVISLASLLSSLVLAEISKARLIARSSYISQEIIQYRNALQLYHDDNGTYPIIEDEKWHCLGKGNAIGLCGWIDTVTPATESIMLQNALRPYISVFAIDTKPVSINGENFFGAQYVCSDIVDNKCTSAGIAWVLPRNEECKPNNTTVLHSSSGGEGTLCAILLVGNPAPQPPPSP